MGIIDDQGQQWEHCNVCLKSVKLQDLGYQIPDEDYTHGRDVCLNCAVDLIAKEEVAFEDIKPAKTWQQVEIIP